MLKIFLYIITATAFLGGCSVSELSKNPDNWQRTGEIAIGAEQKIQVGDILITPKDWTNPISWWGHSALMVTNDEIGEYPKLGYGFSQNSIYDWLAVRENAKVYRYKNFDAKFRKQFIKNIELLKFADYSIFFDKEASLTSPINKVDLYCSSYVWFIYAKTAQDLGYSLDLDSNDGYFIMPYDIMRSDMLKQIKVGFN